MAKKKRKSLFETIRKTTAPPTQYHKDLKKVKKADKVGRFSKYKNREDE